MMCEMDTHNECAVWIHEGTKRSKRRRRVEARWWSLCRWLKSDGGDMKEWVELYVIWHGNISGLEVSGCVDG